MKKRQCSEKDFAMLNLSLKKKKAQMKLSFGMIFSIILIIIFIAFAFFAIKKFLGLTDTFKIEDFANDLQEDVDKIWKGSKGTHTRAYSLPREIKAVCFKDDAYENLIFKADNYIEGKLIEHIDIAKITEDESPYCVDNIKGKISLTIKMDFGESLVTITK